MAASVNISLVGLAGTVGRIQQTLQSLNQVLSQGSLQASLSMARSQVAFAQAGMRALALGDGLIASAIRYVKETGSLYQQATLERTSPARLRALTETTKDFGLSPAATLGGLTTFRQGLEGNVALQELLNGKGITVTENGELRDTVSLLAEVGKLMRAMPAQERAAFAKSANIAPNLADVISMPEFDKRFQAISASTNASGLTDTAAIANRLVVNGNQLMRALDEGQTILLGPLLTNIGPAFERFSESAARVIPQLSRSLSVFSGGAGEIAAVFLDLGADVLDFFGKLDGWTDGWSTKMLGVFGLVTAVFGPQATGALTGALLGLAKSAGMLALRLLMRHPILAVVGMLASWFLSGEKSSEDIQKEIGHREQRLAEAERVLADRKLNPKNVKGIEKAEQEVKDANLGLSIKRDQLAKRQAMEKAETASKNPEAYVDESSEAASPTPAFTGGGGRSGGGGASATFGQPNVSQQSINPAADFAAAQGQVLMERGPSTVTVQSTNHITVSGVLDPQAVAQHIAAVQIEVNNNLMRSNTGGQVA